MMYFENTLLVILFTLTRPPPDWYELGRMTQGRPAGEGHTPGDEGEKERAMRSSAWPFLLNAGRPYGPIII